MTSTSAETLKEIQNEVEVEFREVLGKLSILRKVRTMDKVKEIDVSFSEFLDRIESYLIIAIDEKQKFMERRKKTKIKE